MNIGIMLGFYKQKHSCAAPLAYIKGKLRSEFIGQRRVYYNYIENVFGKALPYLLSFAAGAMIYVVVEELIPEMSSGEHSNIGTLFFAVGFTIMMTLDVALG